MKRKRKKLTRTEIAIKNSERQFRLELAAVDFAKAIANYPTSWEVQRCRVTLLEAAVTYWRGVQR